jgi:hypothetical protein
VPGIFRRRPFAVRFPDQDLVGTAAKHVFKPARMCASRKKGELAEVVERYLQLRLRRGVDESTLNDPRYVAVMNGG